MWLPSALLHWRRLLRQQTYKLLLFVPDVVGKDRTLSLVDFADDVTRVVLSHVPVAGRAMLTTYNAWIVDAIETAEHAQQADRQPESESTLALAHQRGAEGSRSLHAVCEYYMYRNDGLQRVNRSLVHQISKLEGDLEQAQSSLFQAQCIIARLKEMEDIRCKRLRVSEDVYLALGQADPAMFAERATGTATEAQARRAITPDRNTQTEALETDGSVTTSDEEGNNADTSRGVSGEPALDDDNSLGGFTSAESSGPLSSSDGEELQETVDGDDGRHHQVSAVNMITPARDFAEDHLATSPATAASSSISYNELVELNTAEEGEGDSTSSNWHRRALQRLAQEREQRRRSRNQSQSQSETSSPRRHSRVSFASSIEMSTERESNSEDDLDEEESEEPLNFQVLVALRTSNDDLTTAEWQRRVLQRLSQERERLPHCHRVSNSMSSGSPTNSSTSTLTFAFDE